MALWAEECEGPGCSRDVDYTRDDSHDWEQYPVARYCSDSCCDNAAERAYERHCEAFYGGDVVTQREAYVAAWEQKQALDR